jgi:hypothetical protein
VTSAATAATAISAPLSAALRSPATISALRLGAITALRSATAEAAARSLTGLNHLRRHLERTGLRSRLLITLGRRGGAVVFRAAIRRLPRLTEALLRTPESIPARTRPPGSWVSGRGGSVRLEAPLHTRSRSLARLPETPPPG